jgi:CDGSH-type Zn-finger protein
MATTKKKAKASARPRIIPLPNGPYYLFEDDRPYTVGCLRSSAGQKRSLVRGIALCRCGGSQNKPFCDGTHGKIGFRSDDKTERPGKRKTYVGKGLTVTDDRSICAHAGFCTDNLPAVFGKRGDSFVQPDGASPAAIRKVVAMCPSGAILVDEEKRRAKARRPRVTVTKNGPYAITGGVELLGVPFAAGAATEHYTLCRCGGSQNKPFCDGTHWENGFTDERN